MEAMYGYDIYHGRMMIINRIASMKSIKWVLLLACITLSGCTHYTTTMSESKIEETNCKEQIASRIIHADLNYEITDMIVAGDMIVCQTERMSPVFVCYSASEFGKLKEFGSIGRGHNEWIKPHLVARTDNGYDIFDNGKNKILRYNSDTLVSEIKYNEMVAVNYPRMINERYIGFSWIEPNKTALAIYDADTYKCMDEYVFEDETQGGNAINLDFVWAGEENNIVIGHLYKKEFYVLEINHHGKISRVKRYQGDYEFNPEEHVYYSDVSLSNGHVYLLCQQHVNLGNGEGHSEIDVFNTSGEHIKKMDLDVVAQHMCVHDDVIWLLDIDNNLRVCENAMD